MRGLPKPFFYELHETCSVFSAEKTVTLIILLSYPAHHVTAKGFAGGSATS